MPIRFHDLRATGITWRLARGDTPILVQQDAGHESFQTTEKYIRLARGIDPEAVFPPLPMRVLEGKSPGKAPRGSSDPKTFEKSVGATGIEPVTSSV